MARQKWLPLEGQQPGEFWDQFPDECRREVVVLFAQLVEKAARFDTQHEQERSSSVEPRKS